MPVVTIEIPEGIARYSGGHQRFSLKAETPLAAVLELCRQHPALTIRLLRSDSSVHAHLPLFLNDQKLNAEQFREIRLQDQDRLEFLELSSGG